jgi:hypothetical protein
MEHEKQIPIWFFIGIMLALYGVIIFAYSLLTWSAPPPDSLSPEISKLHAGVWWGFLMIILGLFYVIRFRPREGEGLTGKN